MTLSGMIEVRQVSVKCNTQQVLVSWLEQITPMEFIYLVTNTLYMSRQNAWDRR